VFTDLGTPGGDPPAPKQRDHTRINNVPLYGPRNFVDAGTRGCPHLNADHFDRLCDR